ncbi:hypothetical protein WJX84_001031 [Apatococcus fuscideae]|uniref:Uncharacterized protein n=1 Tax=Apatococcus fuscideae TaxID=2026836 RepID=A0AAW1T0F9_9CHLO
MHALTPSLLSAPTCACRCLPSSKALARRPCSRGAQSRRKPRLGVRAQQGDPGGPKLDDKEPKDQPREEGQTTAIITGAISIIIGVLYLGLVQFMNVRGGELLPPPPEAYDHAFD